MELIVITPEDDLQQESLFLRRLFDLGLKRLHLRKPHYSKDEMRRWLDIMPEQFHTKVVLHDHHTLVDEYTVGGVHLNRRNPLPPEDYRGSISSSCHKLEELASLASGYDYCFFSPVFTSLSKKDYHPTYPPEGLIAARNAGIINHRAVALGGIVPANIANVKEWGFGGVAVLGYLWSSRDEDELIDRYKQLCYNL